MKKVLTFLLSIICVIQSSMVFASDIPTPQTVYDKALEFTSQYPYKEGDADKSFALYPDRNYTSGIEKREDGTEYECPAVYIDEHAALFDDFDLKKGEVTIKINGVVAQNSNRCVLHNGVTLVPAEIFEEAGCESEVDENFYVLRLTKDETVLEILPYIIGMRKNQAKGFYVPLNGCARYVDGELYVPVRAVAEEFDINVGWDGENHAVSLEF